MHVLSNDSDMLSTSLAILMAQGGSSGRDGDRFAQRNHHPQLDHCRLMRGLTPAEGTKL